MAFAIFRNMLLLMSLFNVGNAMAVNAHDFKFKKIASSQDLNLSDYKGKIILIVNVASKCGFTKQYEALEKLYNDYKDRGFVIIGVPSNQFAGQEPGSDEEIIAFCSTKYNVTFPMASKEKVKGDDAHPFYVWASEKTGASPKWNFYKYLIGKDGEILDYFSSMTKPDSKKIIELIERNI